MDLKAPKKSKVGKCSSHLSIESRLHLCVVIAISRTLLKEWFPLKKRDNCPKQLVFITATIAYIFFSSTAVHIYDFHMFTVIYSPPCGFIWTKHNNQLPVGLLAQFLERCTGIAEPGHGFKSRTGLNLLRSYFHNYLLLVFITARIASLFVLQLQFTYMIFTYFHLLCVHMNCFKGCKVWIQTDIPYLYSPPAYSVLIT